MELSLLLEGKSEKERKQKDQSAPTPHSSPTPTYNDRLFHLSKENFPKISKNTENINDRSS